MSEVIIPVKEYRDLVDAKAKLTSIAKVLNSNVYFTGEDMKEIIGGILNGNGSGEKVERDRKGTDLGRADGCN